MNMLKDADQKEGNGNIHMGFCALGHLSFSSFTSVKYFIMYTNNRSATYHHSSDTLCPAIHGVLSVAMKKIDQFSCLDDKLRPHFARELSENILVLALHLKVTHAAIAIK